MMKLESRIRIVGTIEFNTPFHLGSGEEGAAAADLGVRLDVNGAPVLPGSSLKGVFRSTAESLAEHLGMKTCFLDRQQGWCAGSSEELSKRQLERLETADGPTVDRILAENVCDVCRLFGSLLARGRLRFQDAMVESWAGVLEIRDGVGIDRDAGTAVVGVKYNYEVVPAGATFKFLLDAENLAPRERALVAVVVREWERGVRLGGMTSRGMGAAHLKNVDIRQVDLSDRSQRFEYLLHGTMPSLTADQIEAEIRNGLEVANA